MFVCVLHTLTHVVENSLLAWIWASWAFALPPCTLTPLSSGIFRNCLCQGSRGWLLNSAALTKEYTVTKYTRVSFRQQRAQCFKHSDAVLEYLGSTHLSHFTQESLCTSKAKLSAYLELTHTNAPWILSHSRHHCNQQAMCVPWNLQSGHPPASQAGTVTSGSTGLMGRNLLCHSTCITSCLNSTFIFSECFPGPMLLLIGSHKTLGNAQSGSHHSHSHLADKIQGRHMICPRSHFS